MLSQSRNPRPVRALATAALLLVGLTGLAVAGRASAQVLPSSAPPDQEGTTTTAAAAGEPIAPTSSEPQAQPPAPSVRILEARARPATAYYYGPKPIGFAIALAAKGPTDIRIDIIREKSGLLERSLTQLDVPPNSPQRIAWDGLSSAGLPVRGKLAFRVRGVNGEPIAIAKRPVSKTASKKKPKVPSMRLGVFDYIFPVRGKHAYGDGLGAGRGHQGQDVPAKCGTRLVAAQGGTAQVNAYQAGGAGYYVVIDTVGSDVDHVYMHMLSAPALTVGQVVMTGQPIGQVGNTGHSTGCHAHFEMWSGPGWFEGGAPLDPAPSLRAWDRYS